MTTYQRSIVTSVRSVRPDARRSWQPKAVALEAAQALSAAVKEALLVYAITGSAVASVALIVAPHLEVLLRYLASGRG